MIINKLANFMTPCHASRATLSIIASNFYKCIHMFRRERRFKLIIVYGKVSISFAVLLKQAIPPKVTAKIHLHKPLSAILNEIAAMIQLLLPPQPQNRQNEPD
ncbi:hypothetical protein [Paenibacillus sp. CECT 9249]|uniref:hypothetical protein n=1 Tax=Paenibacillus sp. CECT 9249 TaxID=2845385 RepID=UPI001E35EF7F|nr:hypothetical protein [Paenibacillus sp. CECT 9249]